LRWLNPHVNAPSAAGDDKHDGSRGSNAHPATGGPQRGRPLQNAARPRSALQTGIHTVLKSLGGGQPRNQPESGFG
jgi:hypothetical protein